MDMQYEIQITTFSIVWDQLALSEMSCMKHVLFHGLVDAAFWMELTEHGTRGILQRWYVVRWYVVCGMIQMWGTL